jgi:D-amino-acid dehydrogenase
MTTVAIIGAGIVGVSAAVWLRREGVDVVLIDRHGPGEGASYGNAGVLASCSMVPVTTPGLARKAPRMLLDPDQPVFLKWRYLPRLAPWLRKYLSHCTEDETRRIADGIARIVSDSVSEHEAVAAGTPAERYVTPSEYCFAYRDKAALAGDSLAWDIRHHHGFRWHTLEGEAVRAFEPALSEEIGVLVRVPGHGHIKDPGAYVRALADHAVAGGARLVTGTAEDVVTEGGAVTGVRVDGETIPCDAAVVATGAWSGPLARRLGVDVPLESERGYHLELLEPSVMPRAPVMVAAGKFVATPMEGRLRLAGIVEFGGLDAPPSRAPIDLLKRKIQAAMPGLTWRDSRAWMGHRPAPSDSLPVIGAVPGVSGAFVGFGHHHIGLTGGPRTGRLIAQLVTGRRPNVDISPFAPARFAPGATPQRHNLETTG